ncbi:MAG: 3-dehydroquinate synthase [Bacteroidetes bacterium]|nr:3-dehydroquinate synthase [Bacteroidota bacterium]MBU1113746.1 3-dehydroquinate synthase [Bacteroidota bacterium]MBU1800235.1 3-dehydroquinate synthase [Bacteroidota bacterium]
METININLPQNGYNVFVGNGIFNQLIKMVKSHGLNKNLFFVIDKNVHSLYSTQIDLIFSNYKGKVNLIKIEASEKLKSFKTMEKIYANLLENDYSRDTLLIAIGGGIVGDICGFVAATFSRGIQSVQIPTTLLSAVDSSVGGKTGVNFGNTKNIIGAFNQPNFVLIDVNFLKSLNREELLSGLGEVIKYAYLTNIEFHNYIKNNFGKVFNKNPKILLKIINETVRFKGDVVISDEKETGNRKMLNLGHTFAHAFEVESKFKLKHGQAVIIGIASAIFLSFKIGLITKSKMDELLELIYLFKDEINVGKINYDNAISIMQRDKKNKDGKIKFVLLKDVGSILLDVEANRDDIVYALENGIGVFK